MVDVTADYVTVGGVYLPFSRTPGVLTEFQWSIHEMFIAVLPFTSIVVCFGIYLGLIILWLYIYILTHISSDTVCVSLKVFVGFVHMLVFLDRCGSFFKIGTSKQ